jgi:hypothetical protein
MQIRLELIPLPVSDVDRAIAFLGVRGGRVSHPEI